MPAPVTCPNPACARRSTLPDAAAGRAVRCPACGHRFTAEPAPETVGRFVLRAKLGAGAFGTVYRAYDPQLDREVALKVPHAGVLDSPTRVERFLREAKSAGGLAHPHIVPVFEAGTAGDRHYIASAFIDGRPLADAVPRGGMPFDRAARLTRELAEALAFAHGRGVVHRDVKPANAMLDADDRVHLMDFGLATRAAEASRLTTDGAVMGTPAYMAPEQAAGAAGAADPPADQYSAGVVLYELLTGRPPFTGAVAVVIYNAIHTEPEPPSAGRPDVPRDLEAVCLKAMAKRPADRYPDCRFLAADLRRWLAGEPVTARPVGSVERAVRWARRKPALAAVAVLGPLAALLASVTLVVLAVAHRTEQQRAAGAAQLKDTTADLGTAEKKLGAAEKDRDAAATDAARDREAKVRADTEKARKAKQEYARTVELAQREWLAGNPDRTRQLLDACDPAYRGWEWRHVHRLAHAEFLTLPVGLGAKDVRFSPDGARVLARGYAAWWAWDAATGAVLHEGGKADNGTMTTTAVSPDASRLLVASSSKGAQDHQVRDALTGKVVATLAGYRRRLAHAVFSPDGRRVLTASDEEPTARVWDAATGAEVAALAGHAKKVSSVAFSADGARVVTGSADDTARVWEAATGKEQRVIAGDGTDVRGVAFSPDGKRVVLTGYTTRVCEAVNGVVVCTIKGDTRGTAPTPFDTTGGQLLTVDGKTVRVWNVGTEAQQPYALEGEAGVTTAAFAPNGHVIVGYGDGATAVWNLSRRTRSVVYRGHTGPIFAAALAPDAKRLATVSGVGPLRVWDTATRPEGPALAGRADDRAAGGYRNVIRLSADGTRLISAGPSGAFAWDLRTGAAFRPPEDHVRFVEHASAVALAPAANRVLVKSLADARLYLWAAGPGTTTVELKADNRGTVVAAFSPDGSRVVTGTDDGAVRVWDAVAAVPLHERKVPAYAQLKVWFTPDGRRVVYAHIDGPIAAWTYKLWEPATGAETVILAPRKGLGIDPSARNLVFAPDGASALVFWHDGLTQVFDTKTWTPRATLKDQHDHNSVAAFSPDGSRVVVVGQRGPRVWDAATGEAVATLTGHRDTVVSIAFSPDAKRVATTADDGTRLWDPETGDPVLALPGTASAVFSPDGARLITADSNAVFVWDTAPLNRAFRAGEAGR